MCILWIFNLEALFSEASVRWSCMMQNNSHFLNCDYLLNLYSQTTVELIYSFNTYDNYNKLFIYKKNSLRLWGVISSLISSFFYTKWWHASMNSFIQKIHWEVTFSWTSCWVVKTERKREVFFLPHMCLFAIYVSLYLFPPMHSHALHRVWI